MSLTVRRVGVFALGTVLAVAGFLYLALAMSLSQPIDWPAFWTMTLWFAPLGGVFALIATEA